MITEEAKAESMALSVVQHDGLDDPGLRARALQLQERVASQFGGDIEQAIRTLAERYI